MKSTGNDIIDLNKIDIKRTGEPRFYTKILHTDEQSAYEPQLFNSLSFVNYLWLLWSVKESAYKYVKRLEPGLMFSPRNIIVAGLTCHSETHDTNKSFEVSYFRGRVSLNQCHLHFRSAINARYISSVVNDDMDFDHVHHEVRFITSDDYGSQSVAAKQLALGKLNVFLPGELSICRSGSGYPVLYQNGHAVKLPLSLAHHGNYVAYSCYAEPELLPA